MMMGPEPMSRIFFRSVRLGMSPLSVDRRRRKKRSRYILSGYNLPPRGGARPWAPGAVSGDPFSGRTTMIRSLSVVAVFGLLAGPAPGAGEPTYTIKLKKSAAGL